MRTDKRIRVQLVHAWPDRYWSRAIELAAGACAEDALRAATPYLLEAGFEPGGLGLAIFGRSVTARTVLRDGDRLELLRPLQVSPQQARAGRAAAARRAAQVQAGPGKNKRSEPGPD